MQIYQNNGITVTFADSVLQIRTEVLEVRAGGHEGSISAGGLTWRFVQPDPIAAVTAAEADNGGRSLPHLCLTLHTAQGEENWRIFPDVPFVCTDRHPDGRIFHLDARHITFTAVELADKTDHVDNLVKTETEQLYIRHRLRGNLFLADDYLQKRGLLLVKHAPCPDSAVRRAPEDLLVERDRIRLNGCGYGAAYGVGVPGELFDAYRRLYGRLCCQPAENFIMSNTWGDRSRDAAMREDFVLRELDCAAHLGVDIVQLDDGWQKGISANSVHAENKGGVFSGFYAFDKDFWVLDPAKFPGGMNVILKRAEELNIKMGFWFAPDSSVDFGNWQKDVEVIRTIVEEHGAQYIKLDGVVLKNDACEANYLAMLDAISKFRDGTLQFNLDITADERLGYLCGIPYGTLFVENRYSDWKNYYPHNTLRNLWQLSRYIPAKKFQMEVLNPRRNTGLYGNDPLAPDTYDIDWLFASVMAANPLIWMEMQHLTEEDTEVLREIIAVYRKHRSAMADADVSPIGELPDGTTWTGFRWDLADGTGYMTVLRGVNDTESWTYSMPEGKTYTVLRSNTDVQTETTAEGLRVTLGKPRGYAFLRFE